MSEPGFRYTLCSLACFSFTLIVSHRIPLFIQPASPETLETTAVAQRWRLDRRAAMLARVTEVVHVGASRGECDIETGNVHDNNARLEREVEQCGSTETISHSRLGSADRIVCIWSRHGTLAEIAGPANGKREGDRRVLAYSPGGCSSPGRRYMRCTTLSSEGFLSHEVAIRSVLSHAVSPRLRLPACTRFRYRSHFIRTARDNAGSQLRSRTYYEHSERIHGFG